MSYKNRKRTKRINKILSLILICVLILLGSLYYLFKKNIYIKNKSYSVKKYNYEDKKVSGYREIEGINNILLLGSDARSLNENSRSDAIMIGTIDNVHKKIKLTSILRDSYVEIPKHGMEKINHAFAYGGPELVMETLNKNFKIKIDNYVIINFKGFQEFIDIIDGLDVNISNIEKKEMNKFILEVNPKNPHFIKKEGMQKLDGQQVLSYARIRKIGNGDYDRAKRQRKVISLIAEKLKDISVIKYPEVTSKLFSCIKTNIDIKEIVNSIYTIYKIDNLNIEEIVIPSPSTSKPKILEKKGWVLLMNIEENSKILNEFIFNDKTYSKKS